jgi:predicted NBD/HSP70 family sugar kinase
MLAVDIGGTKVAVGLVDQSGVVERTQFPTPHRDCEGLLTGVAGAMHELAGVHGLEIGILLMLQLGLMVRLVTNQMAHARSGRSMVLPL